MSQLIDWAALGDILQSHSRFVLSSHVRPDADAIGSELGLAAILDALGKSVRIVNPSATSKHLQFLDPHNRVQKIGTDVSVEAACEADVHLIVDTSARGQLDDVCKVLDRTAARKVVIDHHIFSDDLQATEFRDVSAAATGVLITELGERMGVEFSAEAAFQLYAAIATDTGWFRFPNTDSRTLQTAARLVDRGAKPHLLYRELYERSSLSRLKLQSRVLERVQVENEGKLAHTWVLLQDFKETGSHPSDTEDLVNEGLTIEGVECAFILVEQHGGQVKASFRSRSGLDVATIAREFGGGGHKQASGAMIPGSVTAVRERVLTAMLTALREPA